MRARAFSVKLADSEDRQVKVTARYTPATSSYFDRSWGNYLPGDPEEIEVVSAVAVDEGANVDEVKADEERIAEAIREAAGEPDDDGPDTREEARMER